MYRQPIGERLDQICRLISHKILRFLSNDGIIDRVVYSVAHVALLVIWPERNADSQSLRGSPFFFRNSDVRGDFELFDVNPIRKVVWVLGHPRILATDSARHQPAAWQVDTNNTNE